MARRTIIEIDQETCNGCGECETGCPEGALRVIDGKARLVGESLCDGLGACIGRCPLGAIRVTERDAEAYDEIAVLREILPQGMEVLKAHFEHLDHHGQDLYLEQAAVWLSSAGKPIPAGFERFAEKKPVFSKPCGAAARMQTVSPSPRAPQAQQASQPAAATGRSTLRNWPIQLHLANPRAPHFSGADLLVAADCTAFSIGSFHSDWIADRSLVIACPKLDSGREIYLSKLSSMLAQAKSVTVVIMEVPCCSGLLKLAADARTAAGVDTPIEYIVAGIDGGIVTRKTI